MKIKQEDYMIMLMELQHMGRLLGGLQMEEQRIAGVLADRRTSHDIQARAQLPKVREDITNVVGIMEVQGSLVNNHIEDLYGFKFKSFKTKDYSDVVAEAAKLKEQPAQEGETKEGLVITK